MRFRTLRFFALVAGMLAAPVSRADDRPLKVFILAGQSNMQGHAHVRTLEHLAMDPDMAPLLLEIQNADGTPRVHEDVWMSYLTDHGVKQGNLSTGFGADENKLGPELTFGIRMQKSLQEPILIIKTAWGGKSLHTDFRPPSAGPFEFTADQLEQFRKQGRDPTAIRAEKDQATGQAYRAMLEHVRNVLADIRHVDPDYDPQAGYELAGFVWFQGWNDMVDGGVYPQRDQPGGYDQYSVLLAHLIRDVRRDLAAPDLPFVIGVLGVGGPVDEYGPEQQRYKATHQNFRLAMAAPANLPEFQGTVANVLTEDCWDRELSALQQRVAKLKQKIKQSTQGQQLEPPAIHRLEAQARTEEFTARELETLEKGISNFEFHYLGSAKIMTCIGQRFAAAMLELRRNKSSTRE